MPHLATTGSPATRPRRRSRAAPWAVWALVPTAVTLLAFNYWPLVRTAVLSFQSSDLFGRPSGFVGLDNYATMLGSADFRRTLVITFTFVGLSVAAKLVVGMALAVPLAARLRGTGFSRAIVLIPMAVSAAVAGLAFRALMSPTYGLLDQIAIWLTGQPAGWITEPTMAMVSIVMVDVWTSIGFVTLLLIAAIDAVPPEVDEAAAIDGASRARVLASITVPLITPTLFFLVVTQSIQAMREFTIIQVVTGGGPARSTQTLVFDIWAKAFSGTADYGAASARGIILLVIIAALTAVQFGILERKVSY
ncbi:permease component of ABC-type sugar transporter [Sanguibacter keddieii DSM 10542]|uniref:Permease component of ABC-type sugar transporter n=1 Tax=Sanguibacter keddieii (strain ATCC 51767 / DSM 10542 / NCFB 3025 / ST-74) TaxID=446469 RepID=D1BI80_SANKS|nr:sugar ABC transporter permease [Sanguibacter keddieii]ACZ20054.1 permease component of ABC-type sugar transporter [Sanguibacter keddieii DSM 10542]